MEYFVSILALVATFYQAYIQRRHNQKSVKPIGQIDLRDKDGHIYILLTNSGIGPMIVESVVFTKDGKTYNRIRDCLSLSVQLYDYLFIGEGITKVVSPSSNLRLFEIKFEGSGHDAILRQLRTEFSQLSVSAKCKDIYDDRFTVERQLDWFVRHA